ncbi:TrbG/VirB9 family P-type conjugative transfer protein [Xanthomonas citri pv. mangiferaeindicae]|uniref:Type IV secretion system protein VirB9 n=2 Tax=Xanthomonas axonopodis TaxID=53413 RepID=A0A1T1P718_9XANT|nr:MULTISPECIES: TrbG/VirB9 family P-type conjugative transfer protein [Xanthomonas]OOW51512.1 type IV secretion system protein VirB9 [Xanthomonas campestris pv. centellae]OOW71236.1 type IV secretion system protein VirB9 [Xanthomonas axonopodis pv. melhusii]OOW76804.1 type IV secretion system protein VirB9 [Xanthomonas axonopodis pv. clitoriae]UDB89795.1 TrbG/VirB9 family P-type conjugative transfer protein [Xanthomonas citri pv. mangiferaeindicae]UDI81413.1 Type IV secretory pathway, VirB9 c
MKFFSRHRVALPALIPLLLFVFPAVAQVVQEYEYEPNRIYPVRTGLGITTQVELSPNEKILDYSTGFTGGWELTRRENVFYLKPKNVDVDTNMMIRTATHSYILELKVVATDWQRLEQAKQAGVQYKVVFTYPKDTSFNGAEEAVAVKDGPQLNSKILKDRRYYYDYDYSTRTKKSWLVPSRVYDDGKFTYINMDLTRFPTGNFPAVFGREKEHSEDFLVNTTVEGNTLIVHGTYPFLVVRHGNNVVGLRRNKQK